MNFSGKNGRRAFTLAELMAVVVIVGILAGIGLGTYRKAGERAQFQEGLQGAHSIMAAHDEYYYDNRAYPTKMTDLAISFPKSTASGLTIISPHFTYTLTRGSYGRVKATRSDGSYAICVYSELNVNSSADACTGNKDFCESVGVRYVSSC